MFRIEANNFLSFETLSFDFANRGLVLIEGQNKDESCYKSNGAGKSSLVDALGWGLYGETIKGDSADKVVNRQHEKDCKVQVEWLDCRVVRYRKHHQFKNDLHFFRGEQDVTAKSMKDTQALIEKELGLSYASFIKSIYFQQSTVNNFANAKDSEQKAIIEDILNLKVLSIAQEWCKEQCKRLTTDIETKLTKVSHWQFTLKDNNNRIGQLSSSSKSWESNMMKQVTSIGEQIEVLKNKKLTSITDFDLEQAKSVLAAAETLGEQIKASELLLRKTEQERQTAIDLIRDLQWKLKASKDKQLIQIAELDNYRTNSNVCPTCKQTVDIGINLKLTSEVEKRVESVKQDILVLQDKLAKCADPAVWDSKIEDIRSGINSNRKVVELSNQLKQKILQEEYRLKELALIDTRILELEKQIEALLSEANPFEWQIAIEIAKQKDIETNLQNLQESIAETETDKSYYAYWVEGFSNSRLKSYIMDSITPFINERANYYAQYLTGGAFQIDISTQTKLKSGEMRDKFAVNLISSVGVDYSQCSGGEKKRIDIAILLALQELVGSRAVRPLQLIILDEVTENLDDQGIERMLQCLKEISNNKSSCFFITQDESMKALFSNCVTVIKENGLSKIIET
jgi:DNA repair exonuclease SbcCD ATPase subunit